MARKQLCSFPNAVGDSFDNPHYTYQSLHHHQAPQHFECNHGCHNHNNAPASHGPVALPYTQPASPALPRQPSSYTGSWSAASMLDTMSINETSVDKKQSLICIFADLLIPGRGDPIPKAAVGISLDDKIITFVGHQSSIPPELINAPRTHVGYLLPGLWDVHAHFTGNLIVEFESFIHDHPVVCGAAIARGFHETLMAGFTSVREVGGYGIEIAALVKEKVLVGPNVFGAGAAIGITGGSCDACMLPANEVYPVQGVAKDSMWPGTSALVIADGIEECRRAVRLQIRRGASCIKIVATGGGMSPTDDPHYRQFSDAELAVMIEEATLQGRSVAIHAHGKAGIMAAVRAGAITIEHGSYLDEEAAELMVKHGVTFVSTRHVVEANMKQLDTMNPETRDKMIKLEASHRRAYELAVQKGVKIAIGTDLAGSSPRSLTRHGQNGHELVWAVQAGLTPLQAIEAATINSAETLGPKTPKKGLIRVGYDADLIALDESPLDNIRLFANADNIKYVWQGGEMLKSPGKPVFYPDGPAKFHF
ncbi:hypothetical protein LCI18_004707 [Fusarium solani-melongenae]|uniref:Uncharacterized protein n=1 Tax=Fusarium solani subsp. cucurbitae TaxID=2747967 RepID=A0ACD3YY34_FUSSC|nr:hypothetical protein LCI18_004707 [Fusarium solani-melongenae]